MSDWQKDLDKLLTRANEEIMEVIDEITDEVRSDTIANNPLRDAVNRMLDQINEDGTCLLCEQSYNFHASNCVVHEVNLAMDWDGVTE